MRLPSLLLLVMLLTGCIAGPNSNYQIKNLAKSDIDVVSDLHRQQSLKLSRELLQKLYRRNPRELAKAPGMTVEKRLTQLFQPARKDENHLPLARSGFTELGGKDSIDALKLAFDRDFKGDRVFALMAGVTGMINAGYGHRDEFFLTDELDHQKLYDTARNLETVAWQLRTRLDSNAHPLLLSNGVSEDGIKNFSYERLFGKLIATQDSLAMIVATSTDRTITRVVHGAASMTLLPI